jgi:hypothetical protein
MKRNKYSLWLSYRLLKIQLVLNTNSRSSTLFRDGYLVVKEANELDKLRVFVNSVCKDLESKLLKIQYGEKRHLIIRKGVNNLQIQKMYTSLFSGDLLVRSYIVSKISNSKLWFPLSKEMRIRAKQQNLPVQSLVCATLWYCHKVKLMSAIVIRELFQPFSFLEVGTHKTSCLYLLDVGLNMKDAKAIQIRSHFVSWYGSMPEKIREKFCPASIRQDSLTLHGESLVRVRKFKEDFEVRVYISLVTITDMIFTIRTLRSTAVKVVDWIFSEQINKLIMKRQDLPHIFLVPSNSGNIRPVWTYLHESLGSEFIFVELSYALDPNPNKGELLNPEILNTWSLVYSPKAVDDSNLVRELDFSLERWSRIPEWSARIGLPDQLKIGIKPCLSVFDVEPLRNWFGISTLNEMDYNEIKVASRFLEIVLEEAVKVDFVVLHKPKREIGSSRLIEYEHLLTSLVNKYPSNYILVPADVSPRSVIARSRGTVSMPCTSTAIIAKDLGKPSVYFDSTNKISTSDPAAANIDILQEREQLALWIKCLAK